MKKECIDWLQKMLWCTGLMLFIGTAGVTSAGSLEPPVTAFDGNGNPRSTGSQFPSWDKKLDSTNGDTTPGRVGCDSDRFSCIWGDTAVRDNETGAVWDRSPFNTNPLPSSWRDHISHCANREVGGRKGWQLPMREQLASLLDTGNNPALPTGHPFINIITSGADSSLLWTATADEEIPNAGWLVHIRNGAVLPVSSINESPRPWCVRGSQHFDGNTHQTLH